MKSLGITIRGSVHILLSIAFIFALFSGENVRAQAIEINANFDSGSIESYTVNGNEVDITLNTDNVGYKYFSRSHALRGNACLDAPRRTPLQIFFEYRFFFAGRGASMQAFPRRAWERE